MEAPDLSALAAAFVEFGGQIFMNNVNDWKLDKAITVYRNVKKPQVLPKLSAVGGPRPYRAQDDVTDGTKVTDRILTVYNSKWDFDYDPEKFINNYLAGQETLFYQYSINQVAKEYLAAINNSTMYSGVRNAAGASAVDIASGFGTIIASEIAANKLVPIATGAVNAGNAVAKAEAIIESAPPWLKEAEGTIFCSWTNFENYKKNYRSVNAYAFLPRQTGEYYIDGYANIRLVPASWMGASGRLVLVKDGNLCVGTDESAVTVAASVRRNIIEARPMMDVGFEIADLDAIFVSDQN